MRRLDLVFCVRRMAVVLAVAGLFLTVLVSGKPGYLSGQAWAFHPGANPDQKAMTITEMQAGSFERELPSQPLPQIDREERVADVKSRYGDNWNISWNDKTGAAARLQGGNIQTGLKAGASDKEAVAWALGFAKKNQELLGANASDLTLLDCKRADGRIFLSFQQTCNGLPVYKGLLKMTLNKQNALVSVSSNCSPSIRASWQSEISEKEASELAASRIGKSGFALKSTKRVIFPDGKEGRPSYQFTIHLDDPLGDWIVVMDAVTGEEYVRYNNYRFGTLSGNVTAKILPEFYDDTPVTVNLESDSIHAFSPTASYTWNMSSNPGWTCQGAWAYGAPNGVAGDDPADAAPYSGHTGTNVYGYNLTGAYANNMASAMYLTTTAINCSALTGTHLQFWYWLGVGSGDKATVQISNTGTTWTTIEESTYAGILSKSWRLAVFDVSSIADGRSTFYVRWGVGPTSASGTYCGWYIDDVEIHANGGTNQVSSLGQYSINYSGSASEELYAELSGPYADVWNDDGSRLRYKKTVSSGTTNIAWNPPTLSSLITKRSWDLSTNPGWATTGLWAYGTPLGSAGDPASGHTGTKVYGYNLSGAYENNLASPNYLTTTAIDCSTYTGTQLRFWRWLGVYYFDTASIQVSTDGSHWVSAYRSSGFSAVTDTAWKQVTYDISDIADGKPTVYIRWAMGPTDSNTNLCGWNVDDIEILADTSGTLIEPGVYDYDEVNVFHHVTIAHNKIKALDPAYVGMDYSVPAIVRVSTDYSNAFWDGVGINFGAGDGSYLRNTALFSDVIYHEYNHGITHHIYTDEQIPYTGESGAMDEGWADYFAGDINNGPMLGEGDLVVGEPYMRTLQNTLRTPEDKQGEVHFDGQIVGGAMWDLREALGSSEADRLIHFARYQLADNFTDYYEDIILTDDNNGNLNDGTPNMAVIAQAFANHGIGGAQIINMAENFTNQVYLNGRLDAGETDTITNHIKSYSILSNLQAALTTSSPYLTVLDGSTNCGSFTYGQERDVADSLSIRMSPSTPADQVCSTTLTFQANGGFHQIRNLIFINAPDQLFYDMGIPGNYMCYGAAGGKFAVRFTPPAYPMVIKAMRIYPWNLIPNVGIELHVWDDDGPNGAPGTDLMTPKSVTTGSGGAWEDFSLGTITITSGEFYLGWVEKNLAYFNGDFSGASEIRTWIYYNSKWQTLASLGSPQEMFVRARYEPILAPTSTPTPTATFTATPTFTPLESSVDARIFLNME